MLYRGFNQNELKKITDVLDRYSVSYHVSVPQESLEYIDDKTKRVDHRFMDNLLQIEIEKEEFSRLPQTEIQKLFDLRIYPEEESPFTEDELSLLGTEAMKADEARPDKNVRLNQIAAILAVVVVGSFFLWKNGFFK